MRLSLADALQRRGIGGPHAALRRQHARPFHNARLAILIQQRHERLAGAQLQQCLGGIEGRILAEGRRCRAHRLLLGGRVGAQPVLDAVGKLREHLIGNVGGRLTDEVDADALGADELHRLHDFVRQLLGHVVEQQVRLVEEEHKLGLRKVTDLGQKLVDFAEHPQQKHGVHLRRRHELRRVQDVHRALLRIVGHEPISDIQRRFAEEDVAARIFQGEQRALNGANRL